MKSTDSLTADHYLVTHFVDVGYAGVRLDQFLKARYRKRSREQIKRAIDEGAITVKRTQSPHLTVGKLKPASQLVPGDEVLVLSERKPEPEVCFDYKLFLKTSRFSSFISRPTFLCIRRVVIFSTPF